MCCITDQWTDDTCALCGHAKHVPTIACVDMSQLGEILSSHVMCRYAGESLSLPPIGPSLPRLHHPPPHAHPSSNTISTHIPISLRSWQHIHFHPQWRNQSVASPPPWGWVLVISVIAVIATYDSISLLRLELVPRTKDLRSYKRCKLRSFYDEISTCTTINSSFTQTRTAQWHLTGIRWYQRLIKSIQREHL